MNSYVLILVLIAMTSSLIHSLWKVFYKHGNIGFVDMDGKEVWVIKFSIPEDKIKRKKYILLKVSDVKESKNDFLE